MREAKDLILNQKVHWIQGTVQQRRGLGRFRLQPKRPSFLLSLRPPSRRPSPTTKAIAMSSESAPIPLLILVRWPYAAAKTWGGKKVFIIGPDYEYGHRCKEDFMDAYTKLVPDAKVIGELRP